MLKNELNYRFRIIDAWGNFTYLEVDVNNHKWAYMGKDRTPHSLSNIADNAAEFGFALTDADTYADVEKAITKFVGLRKVEWLDSHKPMTIHGR